MHYLVDNIKSINKWCPKEEQEEVMTNVARWSYYLRDEDLPESVRITARYGLDQLEEKYRARIESVNKRKKIVKSSTALFTVGILTFILKKAKGNKTHGRFTKTKK